MPVSEKLLTTAAQFSFVITALVTMAGWFVVSRQADRREFRKEVREHMAELRARSSAVRLAAQSYWIDAAAKDAPAAAAKLKTELNSLSRQLGVLRRIGFVCDDLLMVDVRQEATGGDFEKKGRRKSRLDVDRLINLHGALDDLLTAMDEAFYEQFGTKPSNKWLRVLPIAMLPLLGSDSR